MHLRALATLLLALACAPPTHAAIDDFRSIFTGKDLSGWEGDPALWSAEDGVLRGHSDALRFSNTFLIWTGGTLRDFHLRLEARLFSGNSGIQYRSRKLGRWTVGGYQAEIANDPGKAGFLYEERGRKFLAYLGQSVQISPSGSRSVLGVLGAKRDYLGWRYYQPGAWNRFEIVAVGPYLAHYVNGHKTIEIIDEAAGRSAREGVLALQIHAGAPMTVEFKDIRLKKL